MNTEPLNASSEIIEFFTAAYRERELVAETGIREAAELASRDNAAAVLPAAIRTIIEQRDGYRDLCRMMLAALLIPKNRAHVRDELWTLANGTFRPQFHRIGGETFGWPDEPAKV
jgi:hypothetical protein